MKSHVLVRRGAISLRTPTRVVVTGLTLVVAALLVGVLALGLGDYPISATQVLGSIVGTEENTLVRYFVTELRAPRVVGALVVGAALGVSGAIFQNITGNPLGSPDIIGFTTGAATGALVQIIVAGESGSAIGFGAVAGGMLTALCVRLLVGPGGMTGQKLVLVGLGVGATLAAVNTLLVVRASLESAQNAAQWLAGSLNAVLWSEVAVLALLVGILVVGAALLARPVHLLTLGDDVARSVGVPAQLVRTSAVLLAVALVSVATATTGPIAFVALAAPQVARRIAGVPTPGVGTSAVTGALIVLVGDQIAQHAFPATELAVGVVTGALGGIYLIGLLALEWRKR